MRRRLRAPARHARRRVLQHRRRRSTGSRTASPPSSIRDSSSRSSMVRASTLRPRPRSSPRQSRDHLGVVVVGQRLGEHGDRADRRLQLVADVGDEVGAHGVEPRSLADVVDGHDAPPPSTRMGMDAATTPCRGGPNSSTVWRRSARLTAALRRRACRPPRRTSTSACASACRVLGCRVAVPRWSAVGVRRARRRSAGVERRPAARVDLGVRRRSSGTALAPSGPRRVPDRPAHGHVRDEAPTASTDHHVEGGIIRLDHDVDRSVRRRIADPRGVLSPEPVTRGAVVLGHPAGDDEADPLADVHGVVADALVEAGDDGELHGDLEVDPCRRRGSRRSPG